MALHPAGSDVTCDALGMMIRGASSGAAPHTSIGLEFSDLAEYEDAFFLSSFVSDAVDIADCGCL